jgi:non-ribosomal peptide synthetase component F
VTDEVVMQEFENSPAADHNHYVRKVVLPSGKTIEVVSFEDHAPAETGIHVCPECTSQLVYPVAWEEAERARWEVSLRCPNCEWQVTDLFEEQAIQRFDETLDRGTEALVADLRQLTRANMEEDVERFIAALTAGHVLPEDF